MKDKNYEQEFDSLDKEEEKKPSLRRQLLNAVYANDLRQLLDILRINKLRISEPSSQLHYLLHSSIKWGHDEITDWLLWLQGCPVNSRIDDPGSAAWSTALHAAVYYKRNRVIEPLLDKGAFVGARNPNGESPVYLACDACNVEALELLLRKDRSVVDLADFSWHTPLHLAVEKECLEAVQLLLNYGAYVEARTARVECAGCTPLHLAVLANNPELVQLLLARGADFDAVVGCDGKKERVGLSQPSYYNLEYDGFTALHLAAKVDQDGLVLRLLLDQGANVNASVEQTGITPLHVAVGMKNKKAVLLFSEYDANFLAKTRKGENVLHLAVANCWEELVEVLLQKNADPNDRTENGETLLHIAVEVGNQRVINTLLAHKADVNLKNSRGQTPLHVAVKTDQMVAKFLLSDELLDLCDVIEKIICDNDAELIEEILSITSKNPNFRKESHFVNWSILNNNGKMVKLFFKYGYDVDFDKMLFESMIKNNDSEIFDLLLAKGLKTQNDIIHSAAKLEDIEIIKAFLDHGLDVDTFDDYGTTILHFAVWHKHFEFVNYLINEKKARVNIAEKIKKQLSAADQVKKIITTSALHIAVIKKRTDIVWTLLESRADVNSKTGRGGTALHCAVANASGNLDVIKRLLRCGADINIVDGRNKLPAHYIFQQTCVCNNEFGYHYDLTNTCDCLVDEDFDENVLPALINIFVRHVVYLNITNKPLDARNISILCSYKKLDEVLISCLKEKGKMTVYKIYDNVAFSDVLIKRSNALAAYGRNQELVRAFEASGYENEFPLYAELLKDQFDEAVSRAHLLENARSVLIRLTDFNFPQVVVDEIFEHLNMKELNSLSLA